MKKYAFVAALSLFGLGWHAGAIAADAPAMQASSSAAPSSCEDKAVDKNGKKLSGAAKTSFVKKCEADAKAAAPSCEDKAVDKNGKKLSGAAKTSSVKKCEADAKAAK
ncbi:conserved exported hypothetical protein [Burkholderiales bacterium]|nr:conserved exported hypothetical protein [Burkholderiales bacterium]